LIQIPASTSIEFLLDTNVAVDFLNHPAASVAKVGLPARIAIPITVFGELFFGAENSAKVADNLRRAEALVQRVRVVSCDLDTAREFGRVRRQLRVLGKPIPTNDIWIAAAAIQHRLPLLTADAHFDLVAGLEIVRW
jgi:tRNA(fMet)-specific endonuclease VapC